MKCKCNEKCRNKCLIFRISEIDFMCYVYLNALTAKNLDSFIIYTVTITLNPNLPEGTKTLNSLYASYIFLCNFSVTHPDFMKFYDFF